jgi:hypothetical protein
MGSTPGVYTITSSDATGTVKLTVNFDPATGNLWDVGSPPTCVLVVNQTAQPWPCVITTADGTFSQSIPLGTTRIRASQVQAQSGVVNVTQVQVSL